MGVKSKTIHSLSQALGTGVVFLELQLKEYTAAFFTFRDSIFGSDFYGTTCLHGLHVTTGSTSFGILWCSLNNNEGYKEVHQYQKFWGYYWHLVDSIWISLFVLLMLNILYLGGHDIAYYGSAAGFMLRRWYNYGFSNLHRYLWFCVSLGRAFPCWWTWFTFTL